MYMLCSQNGPLYLCSKMDAVTSAIQTSKSTSVRDNEENWDFYQRSKVEEDLIKPKRFHYTSKDLIAKTSISRSMDFEASPPIIHFAGFNVGVESFVDIDIINISTRIERMNILPLSSVVFKLDYSLIGSLAPGLSQKVRVRFYPKEYKYYYGCIRIHGEEDDLLVPIHAYPVLNVVEFPRTMKFGTCFLAEEAVKKIDLKCSLPIQFSFELDIIKPHPYITIAPLKGIIPSNGSVTVKVAFNPITLGTCSAIIRLHVAQHGFEPIECVITAQAVSGAIEFSNLGRRETMLKAHVSCAESKVRYIINDTSGPLGVSISNMLTSTFQSHDKLSNLQDVVTKPGKRNFGNRKSDQPHSHVIKGPGSGSAFDPGNRWLSLHRLTEKAENVSENTSILENKVQQLPQPEVDRLSEGFRVPFNLDNLPGVNYVITQETGKLKNKDLRTVIEETIADKAKKFEEQAKMSTKGASAGTLDVYSILKEERMSYETEHLPRRQIREMAFLADVDDVTCTEGEKEFRISNEYDGTKLLNDMDLKIIKCQRTQGEDFKEIQNWRTDQMRMRTENFSPLNVLIKAGSKAKIGGILLEIVEPSFDKNENDIWSKRLNSLRRMVGLVSRYIMRKRSEERMSVIRKNFYENRCFTREEVMSYIVFENENNKVSNNSADNKILYTEDSGVGESKNFIQDATNVALLLCSLHNDVLIRNVATYKASSGKKHELNMKMMRRVLFPKFFVSEGSIKEKIPGNFVSEVNNFDDRSFFSTKIRPEHVSSGYFILYIPTIPVYYSTQNVVEMIGGKEEYASRPESDTNLKADEIVQFNEQIFELYEESKYLVDRKILKQYECVLSDIDDDIDYLAPDWFKHEVQWPHKELQRNHRPNPSMRIFTPQIRLKETDALWQMRPDNPDMSERLQFIDDGTLKSKWMNDDGHLAFHFYAMGDEGSYGDDSLHSTSFLSEVYLNDVDRHPSGLSCMDKDHLRGLTDPDPDIGPDWPFTKEKDPDDDLTDSDSDEDDKVTAIGKNPKATLNDFYKHDFTQGDNTAVTDESMHITNCLSTGSVNASETSNLKKNQVELLRDRKIIELEKSRKERRTSKFEEYYHKLQHLVDCTECALDKVVIQKPFHIYHEDVYTMLERMSTNCDVNVQFNDSEQLVGKENISVEYPSYIDVLDYSQALHRDGEWKPPNKESSAIISDNGREQRRNKK